MDFYHRRCNSEERPLAVLLDGEFGRKVCRLACADFADPSSATSSAVYVLIDAIDTTPRPRTAV
ncbi:hypothetical protein ACVXG9_10510 [Escherichia coli]